MSEQPYLFGDIWIPIKDGNPTGMSLFLRHYTARQHRKVFQFVGPGDDTITISGTLVPEIAGSYSAITKLASMADAGEAYPLANGAGTIFGHYTIDSLRETHTNIIDDGRPRSLGFSLELTRVS